MDVSTAVAKRTSVRAYTDQKIELNTIVEVLEMAARAPSGGNLQPWRIKILHGEKMREFQTLMKQRLSGTPHPDGDIPEYTVYPPSLKEPYRTSRYEVGEEMYALLGISRDEKPKRLEWFANNYQFFGAPAGLFCFMDRIMGPPQWADIGMFLQTAMLLFQERGIDTCAQECWAMYPRTVADFCNTPDDWKIFCGMAIGIRDETHPTSQLYTKRLPTKDWLEVL